MYVYKQKYENVNSVYIIYWILYKIDDYWYTLTSL